MIYSDTAIPKWLVGLIGAVAGTALAVAMFYNPQPDLSPYMTSVAAEQSFAPLEHSHPHLTTAFADTAAALRAAIADLTPAPAEEEVTTPEEEVTTPEEEVTTPEEEVTTPKQTAPAPGSIADKLAKARALREAKPKP